MCYVFMAASNGPHGGAGLLCLVQAPVQCSGSWGFSLAFSNNLLNVSCCVVLSCVVLSCVVLSCVMLCCLVLSCVVLCHVVVLSCLVLLSQGNCLKNKVEL